MNHAITRLLTRLIALSILATMLALNSDVAASDAQAGPESCPDEAIVIDASKQQKDGIADELQDWIDGEYGGKKTRALADTSGDAYFGRTFTIPSNVQIDSAFVTMEVNRGGSNDSMALSTAYGTGGESWWMSLGDLGIGNNKTGQLDLVLSNLPFEPSADHPKKHYSLLNHVIAAGRLDVTVQDDSAVNSLALTLCVSTACRGESIVLSATKKQKDGIHADFQSHLDSDGYTGKTDRDLGNGQQDRLFGRSFDIPSNVHIDAAYLSANIELGGQNDGMGLAADFGTGTTDWYARLNHIGVSGQPSTIELVLSNLPKPTNGSPHPQHDYDMLATVTQSGRLDVKVQDDSAVNDMTLTLCISTECPAEAVVLTATKKQKDGIHPDFQQYYDTNGYTGKTDRDLGNGQRDRLFGRTFTIPSNMQIDSAFLTVDISQGGGNDGMAAKALYEVSGAPAWGIRLNDLGIGNGNSTVVDLALSNLPKPKAGPNSTHTYDLVPAFVQAGRLDIGVQDDSAVNALTLTLCTPAKP